MRIMVTGARAPAALELMRALEAQGHEVYSADAMRFPLARFSKSTKRHIRLPAPNKNLERYIAALKAAILEHQIDVLIPTCEEVFFISRYHQTLRQYCMLFLEPLEKLAVLHHKYDFMKLAEHCGIEIPQTVLLQSDADKKNTPKGAIVLKPVFSRFASHVLIKPSSKQVKQLKLKVPYVAQRYIEGQALSAYCIAKNGKLLSHVVYHPKYTAGLGAGIYFEPIVVKKIESFAKYLGCVDICPHRRRAAA